MLKIITKKEQQEIEKIKQENEFLSKGWRAINRVLDYQMAIVAILETMDSVADYKNVKINGLGIGEDLILQSDQIPVLEGVDINAYN